MTIYTVSIGDRSYQVNISDNQLLINGEKQQAKLVPLNGGGLYLLRWGGQIIELHFQEYGRRLYEVTTEGRRIIAQVEKYLTRPRQQAAHRASDLVAPMPGLVVSVHVAEGDEVEQGQVLVTLESMKMQMELRSPVVGRVSQLSAHPGAQVDKGSLLVRIDQE